MSDPQIIRRGEQEPAAVADRFRKYAEGEPASTRPRRIAFCLTLLAEVQAEVVLRWFNLFRSHWWPGPIYHARDMYVTQARNFVLAQALREKDHWDDVLFWDSDQMPPIEVPGPLPWQAANGEFWQGGFFTDYLQWLAESEPHKKVIGGLYYSKEDTIELTQDGKLVHGPHDPVAYREHEGGYHHLAESDLLPMLVRRGLYQVDGVGTGSMLIRKEIIERMHELKGGDIFEAPPARGVAGQEPGGQWTEDLYFCDQVRKELKEIVWLDTAMESAHFQRRPVVSKTYLEAHGYTTGPHEQSVRALMDQERMRAAQDKRERKASSRIIVPRPSVFARERSE